MQIIFLRGLYIYIYTYVCVVIFYRIMLRLILIALLTGCRVNGNSDSANEPHHRQKRVFWITNDGRIALPPGTIMTITPTLALPFVRYPPHGFLSNMTISLPFTSTYSFFFVIKSFFMILVNRRLIIF